MAILTEWLRATARVRVQGASVTRFLNACAQQNLAFQKPDPEDEFSCTITLRKRDLEKAQTLSARSGCTLSVLEMRGAPIVLRRCRKRFVLIALAVLSCAALLWSSLHIWEIDVQSAEGVEETEIRAALDRAGVRIGSFWPTFSNAQIQCAVLQDLPQLSWLAVNINGSHATVSLRERVEVPEIYDEKTDVRLVASKAGLVTKLQVLQGRAVVSVGQTVLPGETLVSCELPSSFEKAPTRLVHAKAQVFARTWYNLCACAPLERTEKRYTGRERRRFALEIGNRRINLYNVADNSRNLHTEYDTLSKEYRLAVRDVFTTPLALVAETRREFTRQTVTEDANAVYRTLEAQLLQRLQQEIGEDGTVTAQSFSAEERDGCLYVTLHAECVEDIAREELYTPEPTPPVQEE
ncbi:MAG: sporulation protein YqfD [Oscillospiraceae bacterium]|nr:sporulation protein YqfD [Oscillospiraceae bacterium]